MLLSFSKSKPRQTLIGSKFQLQEPVFSSNAFESLWLLKYSYKADYKTWSGTGALDDCIHTNSISARNIWVVGVSKSFEFFLFKFFFVFVFPIVSFSFWVSNFSFSSLLLFFFGRFFRLPICYFGATKPIHKVLKALHCEHPGEARFKQLQQSFTQILQSKK